MKKRFSFGLLILLLAFFSVALHAKSGAIGSQSILISPQVVQPGDEMRILVVFEEDIAGIKVETASPQDVLKPLRERRNKGFPSWVFTENKVPSEGLFRIAVTLSDEHIYSYA